MIPLSSGDDETDGAMNKNDGPHRLHNKSVGALQNVMVRMHGKAPRTYTSLTYILHAVDPLTTTDAIVVIEIRLHVISWRNLF